jgi:GntR family transcriptional regulator / MocR family aminotransferase
MLNSRTSSAPEILLPVDRDDPLPLHRQLEQQIRDAVRSGRLEAGSPLPSTRDMAEQLGVARGVVVEAYDQLSAEGYLISRPGSRTRVARVPSGPTRAASAPLLEPFEIDLRPGRPDVAEFPRQDWMRSTRRALIEAPASRLGYLDGRGMPELRTELSAYLNRVRGTCTAADQLVITAGFAQALRLVATALRAAGARRMAVEDPWHPEYREMIAQCGLDVVSIPVDGHGIRVELLAEARADALVLTPAHQFPTGAVLPPDRRAALIDWADDRDATIIEDDYDAEFRFDREPIGAMQGLCPHRVVYAGTASKILAPGLRLGWVAVPDRLLGPIATAKLAFDQGSAAIDQLALADFIARGELDRHLRRMRGIYRRRRDAMLAALARHLPDARPEGASAGLHVLAWLPSHVDELRLIREAAARGVGINGLSRYWSGPDGPGGIVFGYAGASEQQIEEGISRLGDLIPRAVTSARRQGSPNVTSQLAIGR